MTPARDAGGLLLRRLRAAGDRPVSGSRLAAALGLTRAAVHKRMALLRRKGYRILGTNRAGYRLLASDVLDPAGFPGPLGTPFFHFPALASTQEDAKRRALAGAPEGTLVSADRQTAGRGRLGRRWISPPGGLWFSLLLRPRLRPGQVPALALVAALEWARAVRRLTGLRAEVKWPNDVWIGGRKLAGILTEMSSELDRVHWVVMGAGINVNNRPPARTAVPAESLARLVGEPVPRQDLLASWLAAFARSYARYQRDGFPPFAREYERHSLLSGRPVVCATPQGRWRGRVRGVDGEGRLLLSGPGGTRAVSEGEILPRRGAFRLEA